MEWFRFYNRAVHDPKVQTLPLQYFKFWVNLLCLSADNGGVVPGVTDLSFHLRMRDETVVAMLGKCIDEYGLFDRVNGRIEPHDWKEWQRRSDVSTDRVKKFRNKSVPVSETEAKRDETVSDAFPRGRAPEQSRTETEQSRTEQSGSPLETFGEDLYRAHPKKGDRGPVFRLLSEIPGIETVEVQTRIATGHSQWCATEGWRKAGGTFAPKLAQWILDKGWLYPPSTDETEVDRIIRETLAKAGNGGAQ